MGHGLCAELLPERIGLDDCGYSIIKAGAIPAELTENARRAIEACPVLALRLKSPSPPAGRLGVGVSRGVALILLEIQRELSCATSTLRA